MFLVSFPVNRIIAALLRWRFWFATPFTQTLQENVKDRYEGDGQQGGGQHPSKDGCADGLLAGCAGRKGKEQRNHSQDEGKGSMTMGRNRRLVASTGRLGDEQTIPMQIAGKLTIRMVFLLARAIISTRPIWV